MWKSSANSGSDDGSEEDEDEEESALDAPALLNLFKKHQNDQKDIFKAFPSVIHTGLFDINCDKLRDELVDKHKGIAERVLGLLSSKVAEQAAGINQKFENIDKALSVQPKDIEEPSERRFTN